MNCKVIATSFDGKRDLRKISRFPSHAQHIRSERDVLAMVKELVELEVTYDAGVPYDTIFVVSGHSFPTGNAYVQSLDGRKTRHGTTRVLIRENIGGSFGAYSDAFDAFEYDYWLFTEDDIVVGGDNYYANLIHGFENHESRKEMGFLGLIRRVADDRGVHVDGGVGLSHRTVLEHVKKVHDRLPHSKQEGWHKEAVVAEGEVLFTDVIHKLGYEVDVYNAELMWGLQEKHCVPYSDLRLKLNLGCGRDYKDGYINADISNEVGADEVFDVTEGIPYGEGAFVEVTVSNVLCQIADFKDFLFVMNELWRVTNGVICLKVPNALDICAFQDPADSRRFTDQSFTYMEHGHRRYEQYGKHYGFKPFAVELLEDNGRMMSFKLTPIK